jgi:predicted MFS family arabinose efflux permease
MSASKPINNTLPGKRLAILGVFSALVILAIAMSVIAAAAYGYAEKVLTYETLRKAEGVALAAASTFDRAAELGIPLDKIPNVVEDLGSILAQHRELSRIAVIVNGEVMFEARDKNTAGLTLGSNVVLLGGLTETVPIQLASGASELLEVAINPHFIDHQYVELMLDLLVILIVAAFITLELVYFLAGSIVVSPLRRLIAALSRLRDGHLASSIPAYFPGALNRMAIALRQQQNILIADYVDARKHLRARLVAMRQRRDRHPENQTLDVAADSASLRAAIHQLRAIRDCFGLATRSTRETIIDSSAALGRIRAPFFLLLMAEDLSRSFLPLYTGTMDTGSLTISPSLIVGLPIFLFMFIVAISQPVLGGWTARIGRRNSFLLGALLAFLSHLLAAQATTLFGLMLWRAIGGAAWAIGFVAAQGMVLDYTDKDTRTKGLASFVTVIMVSLACGPAIGGLLADGIGYRATFFVAAVLAFAAIVLAWLGLPHHRHQLTASSSSIVAKLAAPRLLYAGHPFTNWRFVALLLLTALPAKLILISFCFYLLPLYLTASGNSAAMSGRIIMIYSVLMVVLVPIAADMLDRIHKQRGVAPHAWFVGIGGLMAGTAGMAMFIPNEITAAIIMMITLGVAQAISISPQAAMIPDLTRNEIAVRGEAAIYGYYRLVERIGSAVGPLAGAMMLHFFSYRLSFVAIGAYVIVSTLIFALIYVRPLKRVDASPVSTPAQGD